MGYLHISNLYKDQTILMFRECYALEKVHGTSAHITWKRNPSNPAQRQLVFFSGGESHAKFVSLFDEASLRGRFEQLCPPDRDMTVYGEAYGGKQQGMSATYGKELDFIAFDVQIGEAWLNIPNAEDVSRQLGIEFVPYCKVSTEIAELDKQRDLPSEVAQRRGCGNDKKREGVVLRPLVEMTLNNGSRVIAKHKGDEFRETATPRVVDDPAKLKAIADAEAVANEWVVPVRMQHVLDKLPGHCMERMRDIIAAMVEDVKREGAGEIVWSPAVEKAVSRKTAILYKQVLESALQKSA